MHILGTLFGNPARAKLLRLFIFNPEEVFARAELMERANLTSAAARRELAALQKIGFIKRKRGVKVEGDGEGEVMKRRMTGWGLDPQFPYLSPLQDFLLRTLTLKDTDIVSRFRGIGTLKLIVVSGVFLNEWDRRIDIIIVGDRLDERKLTNTVRALEAEIGCELRYAHFSTEDFRYRVGMYDRLMRDVFDNKHRFVLDKLNFGDK